MSDILSDAPTDNGGQADQPTEKQWYEGADADTIGYIQNKKWDNPLKAVEGYRNLEKFHGVPADQLIKLPKPDDAEGWNGVYNRLGRPESPDKYGFDDIKLPEGAQLDKEFVGYFDQAFHKVGLTKAQRDAAVVAYAEYEQKWAQEQETKLAQEKTIQIDALKKDWGDKFDERVALAKRAFKAFVPDGVDKEEVASALEASLGTAIVAKMFANLADRLGEDKFHDDGDKSTSGFGYSREQAINDKNTLTKEISSDPARLALYNQGKGNDYDKMQRLLKVISGA